MVDVTTLTPNEQSAALVLLQECLNGMGGNVPADLEGDEYTWCDATALVKNGWTKESAAGTFSALAKKGVVIEYEPGTWVLDAWRDIATLWDIWVECGKVADDLDRQLTAAEVRLTQQEDFTAALIKAGADEETAKNMGIPFPGIICATLRSYAWRWNGTRATFIKTAQLAGFNRFTAQTQWQRARKEGMSIVDATGQGGYAVDVQEEAE